MEHCVHVVHPMCTVFILCPTTDPYLVVMGALLLLGRRYLGVSYLLNYDDDDDDDNNNHDHNDHDDHNDRDSDDDDDDGESPNNHNIHEATKVRS